MITKKESWEEYMGEGPVEGQTGLWHKFEIHGINTAYLDPYFKCPINGDFDCRECRLQRVEEDFREAPLRSGLTVVYTKEYGKNTVGLIRVTQ